MFDFISIIIAAFLMGIIACYLWGDKILYRYYQKTERKYRQPFIPKFVEYITKEPQYPEWLQRYWMKGGRG